MLHYKKWLHFLTLGHKSKDRWAEYLNVEPETLSTVEEFNLYNRQGSFPYGQNLVCELNYSVGKKLVDYEDMIYQAGEGEALCGWNLGVEPYEYNPPEKEEKPLTINQFMVNYERKRERIRRSKNKDGRCLQKRS